jgi:PKD repeat protein
VPRRVLALFATVALLGAAFCASASGTARFYTPDYGSSTPEEIGGFDLGPSGTLTPIPGSPFPAAPGPPYEPAGIWGLAFTPFGERAVSGFLFYGGVQGYSVPASGIFSLAGSAVPTPSVTSIAVSPDGRFAYAPTRDFGGAIAEGIRRFAIGADGSLSSLSPSGGSGEYGDVAVTPDGRFLFAVQAGKVERFAIGADGSLASLGSTTAPLAQFLAITPDGRFLLLADSTVVQSFAIGADGGLAPGSPLAFAGSSLKVPGVGMDSRYFYVPDYNKDVIHTIAIADGALSVVGETPVENVESVSVSPDGRHLVFYRAGGSANAIGAAVIGANGVPTVLPFEAPWSTGEPERLVFQPQPPPVARFTAKAGAPGEASSFDARASARAVRYDWNFGDGTTLADGGPTPTHVYAAPGVYPVTLTLTDTAGCSTRRIYTGQSTLCPGGSETVARLTVDTLPALGAVKAVPRKFIPKVKGVKAGKAKRGTSFRYTLNEPATVRFKIERKTAGRLSGKRCVRPLPRNRILKSCFRFKLLGSRSQAAKAGANKLKWNGKLKGKPLPAGSYRATVVATDKAGGRSAPKTVGFRVLPLPEQP